MLCDGQLRLIIETLWRSTAGRGDRPVRIRPDPPPGGRRHPDPRYGTTGQRLCRRCGEDRMPAMPATCCACISYGAASKPEMRRASHFSAMPDSPKRGSGKSGCGLPTDSTTRFSCKKYYDLHRLAQRRKN